MHMVQDPAAPGADLAHGRLPQKAPGRPAQKDGRGKSPTEGHELTRFALDEE